MICFEHPTITIINDDFLTTKLIEDNSIDLTVTSPPYNVGIDYKTHPDTLSPQEYIEFSRRWLTKCLRVSKPSGRLCLNIALDTSKGGSIYSDIVSIAKQVGWKYRTTIVWNEGNISRRTAWGSWLSASAPHVIAPVEMIAVFYKEYWPRATKGQSDITREEFIEWTNGLWTFSGASAKRIGHPAPFPLELPKRCIKLFSFVGDTVLDPFLGSGTTVIAAHALGRRAIGVEINPQYCNLAIERFKHEIFDNQLHLIDKQNV